MKKIPITIIFILFIKITSACEICGCSSGNYFVGPFPSFHKHFFGTRYTFRRFRSEVSNDPSQFSNDFYQTVELFGGWNFRKKWQVLGFLPYNVNKQASDDAVLNTRGFGDATLIINYNLLKKRKGLKNSELWIGTGAKLPVGTFITDSSAIVASANNQSGTGSYDFLLNAIYTMHINKWGFNSNINYKFNGSKNDYKFGNRLSVSTFVYRSFNTKVATFSPNIGLLYEYLHANELNKVKIDATGGNTLLASAGIEINFGKTVIGTNLQLPITQNLSGGQTITKINGMLHLSYTF